MDSREPDTIPFPSNNLPSADASDARLRWARFKPHFRLLQKWWLRPHKPYQPLFVIATWRSGSNLLLSYLKQQPNVAMLSEVLCSRLSIGPSRDCIPAAKAIKHIRYCLQGERTAIRGCKLMLHHLTNCALTLNDLEAEFPEAKYIILYRQSLAEQFVSLQIATATRQFRLPQGEQPRRTEIVVNAAELRDFCDDFRRRYHDALDNQWLEGKAILLSYEELVADPNYWLKQQICPLLDVPFAAPETRLAKQNTRPLAEQIVNYREVAALLHSPLCRQQHHWPWRETRRRAA